MSDETEKDIHLLREKIRIAEKVVEEIKSEKLREIAFGAILTKLLCQESIPQSIPPVEKQVDAARAGEQQDELSKLASSLKMEIGPIRRVFEVKDGAFIPKIDIKTGTIPDNQLNALLLCLTANELVRSEGSISSVAFGAILARMGVSKPHLAENIAEYGKGLVNISGKGGRSTVYSITTTGRTKGEEMIRTFAAK